MDTVALLPASCVGLVGGLLVGTTGVGAGSVIAALLLVFYPGIAPQIIVGSATAQAVVMKLLGVWARRRFQLQEHGIGLAMAGGAIPLAIAGAWWSSRLRGDALRPLLAAVLVAVGLLLVWQALRTGRRSAASSVAPASPEPPPSPRDPRVASVGLLGAGVGFVAGLTSVGTGTLYVSALAGPLRIEIHRAVAAALLAGLLTLVSAAITHGILGQLSAGLVAGTCLGSIPGVLIGSTLANRLPARWLRAVVGAGIALAALVSVVRLG